MPLSRRPLELTADPRSVGAARRWITDLLTRLGRDDLVDAASLGVSELVTNAILHAEPPITVTLRGTRSHPRVEVSDHSQNQPSPSSRLAEDAYLLSTIGRGLGLVALYSSAWGSAVAPTGKTVWFEPSTELNPDGDLKGEIVELDELLGVAPPPPPPSETIAIQFLDMPAQVFGHFRHRYRELRRELSLLALAHGADYPVARDLADLSVEIDQQRQQARGVEQLDEAIEAGLTRVDLEYVVPVEAPTTMGRLLDMLERADKFCREERLLALAAGPQQLALQRWYLGEFVRQAEGQPPTPWSGEFHVVDPDHPAA